MAKKHASSARGAGVLLLYRGGIGDVSALSTMRRPARMHFPIAADI
jgi:hypothetical protein